MNTDTTSLRQQGELILPPILEYNETFASIATWGLWLGAIATLIWALNKLAREKEALPLVLWIAGCVTTNVEPVGDLVGQIVWASDMPWFSYTLMNRDLPSFILVGLAPFYAVPGYYLYKQLLAGASLRRILIISVICAGVPEFGLEMLMVHYGVLGYYGNPTLILGLPIYTIVQNSTLLAVVAVGIYFCATRLRGLGQMWIIIAMPGVVFGYVVGATWPVYIALASDFPSWIIWLTALWACAASIGGCHAALHIPELKELRAQAAATPH